MASGKFVSGFLVSFLALVLGCMAEANPQFGNSFPKGPGNYDLPPPPEPIVPVAPLPPPVPLGPVPVGPFPGLDLGGLGGLGGILGGLGGGLGGFPFGLGGFPGFTPSYVPQTWLGSVLGAKSDFLFPLVIFVFFVVGVWAVIQFLLLMIVPIIGAKLGIASALLGGKKKLLLRREVSDTSAEADDQDLSDLTLNVVNATEKSY